jgi:hypothetical protein
MNNKHRDKIDFTGIAFVVAGAAVLFFLVIIVPFVVLPHNQPSALAAIPSQTPTSGPTITLLPTITPFMTRTPYKTKYYRPITWMQLVSFLEKDPTNLNKYTPDYVCIDFAADLVENATNEDIQAWIVVVQIYGPEDHAIAAFKTTDRGTVYIEPQTDIPYKKPTVGQPLCEEGTKYKCFGTIVSLYYAECDHSHNCTYNYPLLITLVATP